MNNFKSAFRMLAVFLLIAFASSTAFAQRLDGTLRGEVKDQQGAVVSDAKVTATNTGTGVSATATTTSAGTYNFPNLIVGNYTVTVEKSGFAKYSRTNVQVQSNQTVEAPATLAVGGGETVVEVIEGAALVQTDNAQLDNTYSQKEITSLPTGSANALNLAILAPNTTTQQGGVAGTGGAVGGNRPRNNNFSIDGVDDNDVSVTGPISTLIQDSISEFVLTTNQFSAEYGHSAAGQFNIITKTGTNKWHGGLFEFFNNRALNALDNQTAAAIDAGAIPDKPRFDYNIMGGSVGGPVIKDRFFIFGAFQKQWAGFAGSALNFDAPTTAGLATLQGLAQNAAVTDILNQFPTAASNDLGVINVCNQNTLVCNDVEVGTAAAFAPSFLNEYDWNVNGDLNLGNHQVRGRFLYNRLRQPNLPTPPIPQFGGDFAYDNRKYLASDVWSITNSLVNDARIAFTRNISQFTVPPAFSNFPNVSVNDLNNFTIGPESNSPQGGIQNTYQAIEQMAYVKGRHSWKWGAQYVRWIAPSTFLPRGRGEWQYADMSELVSDFVPTVFAKRGAGSATVDGNQSAFYGFVQDDFKVTPRLTLNLGIRYELTTVANVANAQTSNAISNCTPADVVACPYDFRRPRIDTNNWAPRFGFAWDPTGNGNWALRGGFGIAYDVTFNNYFSVAQPPQKQSEQDPDITCGLPGAPAWCADYTGGTGNGSGFLQGGGLLQVNVACADAATCRANTGGIIGDQVQPKIYTWSFGVQHQLSNHSSIEVRYLGTRGTALAVQAQSNSISAFDNGAIALPTYLDPAAVPTTFAAGQATLADFQGFIGRPYAADGFLGAVTEFKPIGMNIYHAGSADYNLRATRGLSLRANYTWSHNIDNSTNEFFTSAVNPRRAEDWRHLDRERSNSVLNVGHKVAISWVYELPKFGGDNAFSRILLNGWQFNGGYIFQTGQPVSIQSVRDVNGNGDSAGDYAIFNPAGVARTGADSTAVCWDGATVTIDAGCSAAQTVGYVTDDATAQFVRARVGTRTTSGRDTVTSPGLNNFDLSLFKNTHITEGTSVQFRVEMFNALNHPQYSYANGGVFGLNGSAFNGGGRPDYVVPGTTDFLNPQQLNGGSRTIQLGLKFSF